MKKIFLLLAILPMLFSCGESKSLPKVGEKCEITEQCFSAIDEQSFDKMVKLCVNHDEKGVSNMIASGSVYVLDPIYDLTILEKSFGKCKVRAKIAEVSFEVWVDNQFIKPKN